MYSNKTRKVTKIKNRSKSQLLESRGKKAAKILCAQKDHKNIITQKQNNFIILKNFPTSKHNKFKSQMK